MGFGESVKQDNTIKKEIIKTEKDKINIENINKGITNLNNFFKSIPNTFKPENNKEDFEIFKTQNLYKIQDKLNGTGISIDEYLTHRYTAQQLSKSGDIIPNKYEFIKSFNQLNKLLDIDIQIPLVPDKIINYKPLPDSLDDFQTKPEKILALDSVKDYIDSSPDVLMDKDIFNYNKNFIKVFFSSLLNLIKDSK